MDLRHLETFARIVAEGSQAAAARALGHAPSTVTLHLQELEAELGGPLLERHGRTLQLTAIGEATLRHGMTISGSLLALRQEVASGRPTASGRVRIGAIEPFAQLRVVPMLARLFATRPNVHLDVDVAGTETLRAAVEADTLPFALTTRVSARRLTFDMLFTEGVSIAVPPGHPLAARRTVAIGQLMDEPLLVAEPSCAYRAAVARTFRNAKVHPTIRAEISGPAALAAAAACGLGVAIGPTSAFDPAMLAVRPLDGVAIEIGVLRQRSRSLDPLEDEVLAHLTDESRHPARAAANTDGR